MRSVEKRPPPLSSAVAASSSSARRPQSFRPPTIFSPQLLLVLPWSAFSVPLPARLKTLLHPSPTTNRILLISAHGFFARNFIEGERVQSCRSFLLRWLIRPSVVVAPEGSEASRSLPSQLFVGPLITGNWPASPAGHRDLPSLERDMSLSSGRHRLLEKGGWGWGAEKRRLITGGLAHHPPHPGRKKTCVGERRNVDGGV